MARPARAGADTAAGIIPAALCCSGYGRRFPHVHTVASTAAGELAEGAHRVGRRRARSGTGAGRGSARPTGGGQSRSCPHWQSPSPPEHKLPFQVETLNLWCSRLGQPERRKGLDDSRDGEPSGPEDGRASTELISSRAADTMCNLYLANPAFASKLLVSAGTIPALTNVLEASASNDTISAAACCLQNLASASDSNRRQVAPRRAAPWGVRAAPRELYVLHPYQGSNLPAFDRAPTPPGRGSWRAAAARAAARAAGALPGRREPNGAAAREPRGPGGERGAAQGLWGARRARWPRRRRRPERVGALTRAAGTAPPRLPRLPRHARAPCGRACALRRRLRRAARGAGAGRGTGSGRGPAQPRRGAARDARGAAAGGRRRGRLGSAPPVAAQARQDGRHGRGARLAAPRAASPGPPRDRGTVAPRGGGR
jgi:hypothetical protein